MITTTTDSLESVSPVIDRAGLLRALTIAASSWFAVTIVQMLLRDGFDPLRHPASLLATGTAVGSSPPTSSWRAYSP